MTNTLVAASDAVKVAALLLAFAAGRVLITRASLLIGHGAWWPMAISAIGGLILWRLWRRA